MRHITSADEDEEDDIGAGETGFVFFPFEVMVVVVVVVVVVGVVDGIGDTGAGASRILAVLDASLAEDFLFFLLLPIEFLLSN